MRTIKFLLIIAVFISFIIFISCDDSGIASKDTLELSTYGVTDTTLLDNNSVTIDTVKMLLKYIKLSVAGTGDSISFIDGPIVAYIKFGTIFSLGKSEFRLATYDKLKYEVHKLTSTETPPDPEFADTKLYSVIVKGTWRDSNNTPFPFTLKTDANGYHNLTLPDSVVLVENVLQNVTLLVKPYLWFRNPNGGWLNPLDSNSISIYNNNIRNNVNSSFQAFRDNDRNGQPD
jgi:hypothetical protein